MSKGSRNLIDDAIIAENNAKRAQLDITDKLKEEGGIREAAAVFSHEGFAFMLNVMGDIIAEKIEPIIEKKIVDMFQGMGEGMQLAYKQVASSSLEKQAIEKKVEEKIEEMFVQKQKLEKIDNVIKLTKDLETKIEDQIGDKLVEEHKKKVKKKGKNLKLDGKVFDQTFTGIKIPRYNNNNIRWKELSNEEVLKIAYHYAFYADGKDMLKTISTFIDSHQEARAVYQQLCSRQRIKWKEFVKMYRELYPVSN